MGYAVRRITGRCIGLKSKPQGAKKQLTTAVDLDALLALPGGKRKAWLEEEAGTTLPAKAANALKSASSEAELLEALAPRINRELFDGPQVAGGLVFQPTEERRRSGSHYTPRSLTSNNSSPAPSTLSPTSTSPSRRNFMQRRPMPARFCNRN